jgi:hypothetical protein
MSGRMSIFLLLSLLLVPVADAKNKKKQVLPDVVLKAQTVLVVIHPDAGEPLTSPMANRRAQEEVEKAIMKWGRFKLAMDAETADLVVAVRKGHASGATVRNSPVDDRSVIYERTGGDVRTAGQRGRPDLTDPGMGGATDREPQLGNEIGSSEDAFEVYRGGVQYPLDAAPVWRYMAKDALSGPRVSAIEQFKKAIEESEKVSQGKP